MDAEILERFDHLEEKLTTAVSAIQDQINMLYQNGLSGVQTRVAVLESRERCPVTEHTKMLIEHDETLRAIKKTLWVLLVPVVGIFLELVLRFGTTVFRHVFGTP